MIGTIFRRHRKDCRHGRKHGRAYDACSCPVWVDRTLHGKRVLMALQTDDLELAGKMLEADASMQLSTAAGLWVDHLEYLNRAPRTRAKYKAAVKAFVARCQEWGFTRPEQIQRETVEQFVASYQASASKAKALSILKLFGQFCQDQGWAASNPARLVASPKIRGMSSPTPVSENAATALKSTLISAGNTKMAVLAQLLYETGIRLGDALQLEMGSIQGGRLAIRTEKTGGQVPGIPLSDELLRGLTFLASQENHSVTGKSSDFLASFEGKIFLRPSQSLRTLTRQVQRQFKRAFEAAGMPNARIHDFRHSFASRIAAKGGTTEEIAKLMGISPAVAQKTYIHLTTAWQDRMKKLLE